MCENMLAVDGTDYGCSFPSENMLACTGADDGGVRPGRCFTTGELEHHDHR
jgi:hypothetical protein